MRHSKSPQSFKCEEPESADIPVAWKNPPIKGGKRNFSSLLINHFLYVKTFHISFPTMEYFYIEKIKFKKFLLEC